MTKWHFLINLHTMSSLCLLDFGLLCSDYIHETCSVMFLKSNL